MSMSLPALLHSPPCQVLHQDLSIEPQGWPGHCLVQRKAKVSIFIEQLAKPRLLCTSGGRRLPGPGQPPGIMCFTHIIPVLTRSWRDMHYCHLTRTKCQLKVSTGFAQVPTFALSTATCWLLANSLLHFRISSLLMCKVP